MKGVLNKTMDGFGGEDQYEGLVAYHIGRRLRERRMVAGLTQSALGKELGISFQQIQKYENGLNNMNPAKLMRAACALSVPVTYFFDNLPSPIDDNNLPHGQGGLGEVRKTQSKILELAVLLNKIKNPTMLDAIIKFIKTVG